MTNSIECYRCKLVRDHEVDYIGTITCSDDVAEIAKRIGFADYSEEFFSMFCINAKGNVIAYHEISRGDLSSSASHPREIFKRALLNNAGSIVLIHNHPSGDVTPSLADRETTKRIADAGLLLGIPVIDHIIVGFGGEYYSMKAHEEI